MDPLAEQHFLQLLNHTRDEEITEDHLTEHHLSKLKQTREGGYVAHKGLNIETSPDTVNNFVLFCFV
jgi:hypothetical protein